jgi:hypothetical protein
MAILNVETKTEERSLYEILISQAKGKSSKKKVEDDDDDLVDEEPKKSAKSSKSDDDDDVVEEGDVDWNKVEVDDAWDPDFEEFDLPKSKGKKAPGVAKKAEEEDFKVEDDEFKDLFNDGALDDDEEDDF